MRDLLELLQEDDQELWEAPRLLRRDIQEAARTLSTQEVRFLVDVYYAIQHDRIQAHNQAHALDTSTEPNQLTVWFEGRYRQLEAQVQSVLDSYSRSQPLGVWSRAQVGIGPVLAAGLLAHLDPDPPPTVGHWWRFGGLDPSVTWKEGEKRPWNAKLKVILWKIGQSMVKCSGHAKCLYGHLYKQRKLSEQERNRQGVYAEQATHVLKTKRIGKDTFAFLWYAGTLPSEAVEVYAHSLPAKRERLILEMAGNRIPGTGVPMLPPAHIQARAERWAVKIFVSHYHEAATVAARGVLPPKPFALDRLGHQTYIQPMHMELIPGWRELRTGAH